MSKTFILVALLALALGLAGPASAVPIVFTHIGTGSGSAGEASFDNAAFTITATGDTDDRLPHANGFFIDHLSASIDIAGVGELVFVTATRTFVNNSNDTVGFSRAGINGADLFNGPTDIVFDTWFMLSDIGPLTGQSRLLQWLHSPVLTDAGQLVFENDFNVQGTFQARLTPVPEPTTWALLVAGLFAVASFRRSRRP